MSRAFIFFCLGFCVTHAWGTDTKPFQCPQGMTLSGHPPPAGHEVWCRITEKAVRTEHYYRWNDAGTLVENGIYLNGERHGNWNYFDGQGKPLPSKLFDHGKLMVLSSTGELTPVDPATPEAPRGPALPYRGSGFGFSLGLGFPLSEYTTSSAMMSMGIDYLGDLRWYGLMVGLALEMDIDVGHANGVEANGLLGGGVEIQWVWSVADSHFLFLAGILGGGEVKEQDEFGIGPSTGGFYASTEFGYRHVFQSNKISSIDGRVRLNYLSGQLAGKDIYAIGILCGVSIDIIDYFSGNYTEQK